MVLILMFQRDTLSSLLNWSYVGVDGGQCLAVCMSRQPISHLLSPATNLPTSLVHFDKSMESNKRITASAKLQISMTNEG